MANILFVGDVHGKWWDYGYIISEEKYDYENPTQGLLKDHFDMSIQVGDFGWGFPNPKLREVEYLENVMENSNSKYIRGNHDNPAACRKHRFYINDGTYDEENEIFHVGGAYSIDHMVRKEGLTWWRDEELSYIELMNCINTYDEKKPKIMVTHDGPESIINSVFPFYRKDRNDRTRQALDNMFEIHKPEIHIFGHWHYSIDKTILGTRFICLNELEYCLLNTDTMEVKFFR